MCRFVTPSHRDTLAFRYSITYTETKTKNEADSTSSLLIQSLIRNVYTLFRVAIVSFVAVDHRLAAAVGTPSAFLVGDKNVVQSRLDAPAFEQIQLAALNFVFLAPVPFRADIFTVRHD